MSETTQLEIVVSQSGLSDESALAIRKELNPFFVQACEWQAKVEAVTDPKEARASRLLLKRIRVEAAHKKDELKANVLRYGRAIDQAYKLIETTTGELETKLEEVEKKAEREEAARREALRQVRANGLAPFGIDTTFFDIVNMPEASFRALVDSSRIAHEAKLAAAKKAEDERIAREKAEAEERARIAAENERLKREAFEQEKRLQAERAEQTAKEEKLHKEREAAEAETRRQKAELEAKAKKEREEAEAKARIEREAIEAKARAEREHREKLEREIAAAKKEAEEKAKAEEAARKKAERAPDRDKVLLFASMVRGLPVPAVKSAEAQAVTTQIREQIEKLAAWTEKKGGEL